MSNVISAADGSALQAWSMPQVDGPSANRRRETRRVGELEAVERAAWEESYAAGLAAGETAGRTQLDATNALLLERVQQFDTHLTLLARPLTRMDEQVQRQVAELAITLARHILRRELRAEPAQIIAIVRETVGLLPVGTREVHVHLHPEDAALLRERLASTTAERAWNIVEDPVLARGDCRVTAEAAEIDARLESRLNAAMAALLGDERVAQRAEAQSGEGAQI